MSGQCPEKAEFCRKGMPRSSRPKSSGLGLQIDRGRCLPPLGSYSLAFLKADKSNARPTVAASGCPHFPTRTFMAGSPGREPKAICFGGKIWIRPSWVFPSLICPILLIINGTVMRTAFNRICCHQCILLALHQGFPPKGFTVTWLLFLPLSFPPLFWAWAHSLLTRKPLSLLLPFPVPSLKPRPPSLQGSHSGLRSRYPPRQASSVTGANWPRWAWTGTSRSCHVPSLGQSHKTHLTQTGADAGPKTHSKGQQDGCGRKETWPGWVKPWLGHCLWDPGEYCHPCPQPHFIHLQNGDEDGPYPTPRMF